MFCTNCGRQNAEGSTFCENCGAPLGPPVKAAPQGMPHPSSAPTVGYTPQAQYPPQPPHAPQAPYTPQQPYAQHPPYAQPAYTQQAPYAPQAQPPAKKKKTGLIVGLVLGGVAVVAAVIVIALLSGGKSPVVGTWYSEERGVVLEFRSDGIVASQTAEGTDEGNYTFKSGSDTGVITADGEEYEFSLEGREINIENVGTFEKANSSFDADEFLSDRVPPELSGT